MLLSRKNTPLLIQFLSFTALLFAPFQSAMANLSLDKVVIEFPVGGHPIENIAVTNDSDKPSKVTINAVEVINSGQETPIEKPVPAEKLVVAPKSFEMAPGEKRLVRLVLRKHPQDLEEIYRIRFAPEEVEKTQKIRTGQGASIQVDVIVSMGALIIVPPTNPKPDLQFKREGNIIHFTNSGNVMAQLEREDFCPPQKPCIALPGKRIYAGMKWEMPIPPDLANTPFTQTVRLNGEFTTLSYPAN